jgi:hypothetical protein
MKEITMTTLEDRFTTYAGESLSKREIDEAAFNFMGFVKTVMLMAKENQGTHHESRRTNEGIKQGARGRKIS